LSPLFDVLDDGINSNVDAALEIHWVHPGGDRFGAFPHDCLSQHSRGCGAVAGQIVGLLRDFAHHLGAHVLELVLKLDFLGDRHAVLGDARRAVALVEHDIAPLRPKGDFHCVGESIHATKQALARVSRKFHVFCSHFKSLRLILMRYQVITPMMSDSFMIRSSSPSSLTSVPDHLPNSTRLPGLTSSGISLPLSSRPPGPTAMTSPCCGFSLAVSGMIIPPLVFSSASMRRTTTRSCKGRNLVLAMGFLSALVRVS